MSKSYVPLVWRLEARNWTSRIPIRSGDEFFTKENTTSSREWTIFTIASELGPILKKGGVGAVAFEMCLALIRAGHTIIHVMPCFPSIDRSSLTRCDGQDFQMQVKKQSVTVRVWSTIKSGLKCYLLEAPWTNRSGPYVVESDEDEKRFGVSKGEGYPDMAEFEALNRRAAAEFIRQ